MEIIKLQKLLYSKLFTLLAQKDSVYKHTNYKATKIVVFKVVYFASPKRFCLQTYNTMKNEFLP